MDVDVSAVAEGDLVEMKKPHPCGGKVFEVMYLGMDVRLKCRKCGTQIRLLRKKFGKMVRRVERQSSGA